MNEGWFWRGQIITRSFAMRHAGFLTERDILTPEELNLEPIYATFGVRRASDGLWVLQAAEALAVTTI